MFRLITFLMLAVLAFSSNLRNYGNPDEFDEFAAVPARHLTNFNCTGVGTTSPECNYNGICMADGDCKCDQGYVTHESNVGCNYKQKSKYIAFLWSFFLGMEGGAGEWYLGNDELALGQLLLTWVGLFGICIIACCVGGITQSGDVAGGTAGILAFCWVLGIVLWWLSDWCMILTGDRKDSNGVPTYEGF